MMNAALTTVHLLPEIDANSAATGDGTHYGTKRKTFRRWTMALTASPQTRKKRVSSARGRSSTAISGIRRTDRRRQVLLWKKSFRK
jgi:hypothetical protein